jgi:hypothetical protein
MTMMALAMIVIAMQLGDLILTYLIIKAGGRETWKPMLFLQKLHLPGRWTWLFLPKLLFIAFVWWAARRYPGQMDTVFYVLVAFYAWVLVHNYRVLKKQRSQQ